MNVPITHGVLEFFNVSMGLLLSYDFKDSIC